MLIVKVPAAPSRHRVAVWRALRRIGAVPVGQGVWMVPNVPAFVDGVSRVMDLVAQGEGEIIVLDTRGQSDADAEKMLALFTTAREEEWSEFLADCNKFETEISKEINQDKLTMAELEEEEQSLERLRRWHHDLKKRDVFVVPAGVDALARLRECSARLEEYADLVYARVQQI
ncbi:Chromate resistance protein ChrB [Paenarthrobacter sp. PH39-S1]|uniref:Chromate resistance protein ChrB n=1 Tax=Paenarthrobacter sp. PH39-S1 TaxID=3046204 RepID=UPI0024BB4A88|nr:Chromate resistance protein ChrB [Paenarthrobacter sp. PH39-S1]MDJ0355256.1 chromate resistance protein ChrB [Paenarthrobacter sp. PH39-S1]